MTRERLITQQTSNKSTVLHMTLSLVGIAGSDTTLALPALENTLNNIHQT